jgi:hypothetical protein
MGETCVEALGCYRRRPDQIPLMTSSNETKTVVHLLSNALSEKPVARSLFLTSDKQSVSISICSLRGALRDNSVVVPDRTFLRTRQRRVCMTTETSMLACV